MKRPNTTHALAFAGVWLLCPSASAEPAQAETFDAGVVDAAVFGGHGVLGEPGSDLMGPGVGVRGGYMWPTPFTLSALVALQWGTRDDASEPRNSMDYGGLDAGYQFRFGRFHLRPYLAIGLASVTTTRDARDGFWSPYFGAGISPEVVVWRTEDADVFVGFDVRYLQTLKLIHNGDTAFPATALPAYLQLGATFH